MEITQDQMAAVFTEWMRRYQEDPTGFKELMSETPGDYGQGAMKTFVMIMGDLSQ